MVWSERLLGSILHFLREVSRMRKTSLEFVLKEEVWNKWTEKITCEILIFQGHNKLMCCKGLF